MKDILPNGQIDWSSTVWTELAGRKDPDWLKNKVICCSFHVAAVITQRAWMSYRLRLYVERTYFTLCSRTIRDPPCFLAWQMGQPPVQRQLQQAASGSSNSA